MKLEKENFRDSELLLMKTVIQNRLLKTSGSRYILYFVVLQKPIKSLISER